MSCKIPYIEQRFRDVNPSLADTLNTKYSQIWDSVIESELFKKEEDTGKYLFATSNITKAQKQQEFIDKLNQEYGINKSIVTQNDYSYYRGQVEKPVIDADGNLVIYAKDDELYKRAGLPSKGVSMTNNLQSAIDYGIGQLDVAQNLASETYDAEFELSRLAENGYYIIQIPKNITNEVITEAGEVKILGDKIVVPRGQYKIEQVSESIKPVSVIENLNGYVNVNVLNLPEVTGVSTPAIKEGVEELFDSNPELANQVYEALGFNNNASKYPFPIYKGDVSKLETEGKGISFFTRDKEAADYYTSSRQEQGLSPKTNSTFKGYLDTKNPLIVDALKPSPIELKDSNGNVLGIFGKGDYIEKVKNAGYDAIIINKKFGNTLDGWEIVSFNKSQIKTNLGNQITPQQKQQAQQLYSQYLDTIFPDSKVKDIVYHSRFNKENITNKDRWKNGFYSGTKDQADLMADMAESGSNDIMTTSALLINLQNPKITTYADRKVEDYKDSNDGFIIEVTDKDALQLIGDRDGYNVKNFKKEYVVFKPEQIHILGNKQDIEGFKEFVNKQPKPKVNDVTVLEDVLSVESPDTVGKINNLINRGILDINCS